ncbi:MAG: hypothetical protein V1704_02700 [Candidatus Vogelbacteria bacterium]
MCVAQVSQTKTGKEVMRELFNRIRQKVTDRGFFPGFALTSDVELRLKEGIVDLIGQGRPVGEVEKFSQEIQGMLRGKQRVFFENRRTKWLDDLTSSLAGLSINCAYNDLLTPIRSALKGFHNHCYGLGDDGETVVVSDLNKIDLDQAVAKYWEIVDMLEGARVEHEAREVRDRENRRAEIAERERLAKEAIQARWGQDARELEEELATLPTV